MEIINAQVGLVSDFLFAHPVILFAIVVWTIVWKGIALWKAARLYHQKWFLAILILNTFAILDIIYIFLVARKAEKATDQSIS